MGKKVNNLQKKYIHIMIQGKRKGLVVKITLEGNFIVTSSSYIMDIKITVIVCLNISVSYNTELSECM